MSAREIKAILSAFRKTSAFETRKLTLRITDALVKATPVDTGFARASWYPSLNTPVIGKPKAENLSDVSAAQSQQASQLSSILGLKRLDGISVVWISNNTVYLSRLNEGSSKQAPAKFVEKAIKVSLKTP
jgi:hypothetical protein